jgi:endogenous inhibitor of DNA gyrase (YacG/DUF329 family)
MPEKKPIKIKCPCCETESIWSIDNPHRPFCSEQCRNKDFIGWANEEKVIAGNSLYDDLLSGDIPSSEDY